MKEKDSRRLTVETENLAVPEVHVSDGGGPERTEDRKARKGGKLRIAYDNLAIPEVHVEDEG